MAIVTLESMLAVLRKRTKVTNDDAWLVSELNDAQDWCWQQLYLTNPDVQLTFATTSSLSADAQSVNLNTAVSSTIYGVKTFWIKGAADTNYIPVIFRDENDPEFLAGNAITPAQVIHPVLAAVINFSTIRFANTLPKNTNWQADWIGSPPLLSLQTNAANTSFPEPLHYPTVARAMATIYDSLDDTRAATWFAIAVERLNTSMRVVKHRQFLTKQKTHPYPQRQGGAFWRVQ